VKISALILKQLYTFGSLEMNPDGLRFGIKNRLSDATLTGITELKINRTPVTLDRVKLDLGNGEVLPATDVSAESTLPFPLRTAFHLQVGDQTLPPGKHRIDLVFETRPFGRLEISVEDAISEHEPDRPVVPYSKRKHHGPELDNIHERRRFVEEATGAKLEHVSAFSFDPQVTRGNIENFTGVAQVPIGFAGPLKVNGEHAQGEFIIPLATTEGTLVASYNRGIKSLNRSGGVTCTVVDDHMQRAPVFVFDSAREARAFREWVDDHLEEIRESAESTSRVAKLTYIDTFLSNKFAFLRFNFRTGDAAGQNMVGRATFTACSWILEHVDTVRKFYLESNLATDKKASQVNVMRTRGKRVIAEATIPRNVLIEDMRVEPESIHSHSKVANVGAFLSGANNNGCHSPNAITAMFIATGQDVANVAESSAGIAYVELTPEGGLYMSLTIPSLIVATYGGGTALPTQRECLEVMDCYGTGKVNKLAEIVAGVALAGELSLAAAISSLEWVSSHEEYGRNR
jgi:hydroxymethylglutaryl-CoA reductase (NADPH)